MDTPKAAPTFADLVWFVDQKIGIPKHLAPTPATTLFGDLGLDGDDALEFLAAFLDHFKVDEGDLVPARHFGGEGINPFRLLGWLVGMGKKEPEPVPISLGMLLRAAQTGRWESAALELAYKAEATMG